MHNQGKEFEQIYDIAAVRIIVETKEECYRCLAISQSALVSPTSRVLSTAVPKA